MEEKKEKTVIVPRTFLGYELNSIQDVYFNYLTPTVLGSVFYIIHFAGDFGVTYRHFYDGNPLWASLTLFFMYLPIIICFVLIISSWELFADPEGCGNENFKWISIKIFQHLFFPIWSIWRYAERYFWCIEAVRSETEEERQYALSNVIAPRTIELYYFFQGYLQTVPQIFLQLHLLIRYLNDAEKETVETQIMSLIMNLAKMAITTTLYQRFSKQKVGGRNYPWFKSYKYPLGMDTYDGPSTKSGNSWQKGGIIYSTTDTHKKLKSEQKKKIEIVDSNSSSNRSSTSSDYYLKPIDDPKTMLRETSVIGVYQRSLYRNFDVVDLPKRIYDIKALPEDDMAGKTFSFLWWFTFLIARMISISVFAYFYTTHTIWLLSSHFVLAVSLLLYDAQVNILRKTKAIYFVFIGLIYLFVLIEFKIKFKKVKFWYYGFFTLVYLENIGMCSTWWIVNMEYAVNDWWFKYTFYLVIGCILLSLSTLLFYIRITKPKSVVVAQTNNVI